MKASFHSVLTWFKAVTRKNNIFNFLNMIENENIFAFFQWLFLITFNVSDYQVFNNKDNLSKYKIQFLNYDFTY